MVVFRSTTPWVNPSSRTRSDLLTENSMMILFERVLSPTAL